MRLRNRSQRFWLTAGASLFLGTLTLSYALDVIPVGDGDVLESRVPDFVWGLLFLPFWMGVVILVALLVGFVRRLFSNPSST